MNFLLCILLIGFAAADVVDVEDCGQFGLIYYLNPWNGGGRRVGGGRGVGELEKIWKGRRVGGVEELER